MNTAFFDQQRLSVEALIARIDQTSKLEIASTFAFIEDLAEHSTILEVPNGMEMTDFEKEAYREVSAVIKKVLDMAHLDKDFYNQFRISIRLSTLKFIKSQLEEAQKVLIILSQPLDETIKRQAFLALYS